MARTKGNMRGTRREALKFSVQFVTVEEDAGTTYDAALVTMYMAASDLAVLRPLLSTNPDSAPLLAALDSYKTVK